MYLYYQHTTANKMPNNKDVFFFIHEVSAFLIPVPVPFVQCTVSPQPVPVPVYSSDHD